MVEDIRAKQISCILIEGYKSIEKCDLELNTLMPDYNKVVQGTIIAAEIGLDEMRRQCSHFNSWLDRLENLRDL